ncbi:HNH endonuclease family protein [Corynebacterium simulans]|uniref:GmrSD restriction endonucleases C-terminal domain-containing protein n=1 Tax=Corynebacterium simulans TaxID=146827 RepID=A0ABR5V5Z0_9CORY|nr:HNH endonuclease family protein [Corynebacterium simulans]KXU16918.1 hypothetical protein WM41_2485 [Corynebacterium simulans]
MKHYFLAGLCAVTALWGLNHFLPGPPLGVAEADMRVRIIGYEREAFGGWLPDTKDNVRDAQATAYGLYDPYSGKHNPASVEVDHVFPLSAAWDMGAYRWDRQRKTAFANDPLNLVATAKDLNQDKSDSLPSEWLPPANRCDYSRRLAAVARKYDLLLPAADVRVMRRQCRFDFQLTTD